VQFTDNIQNCVSLVDYSGTDSDTGHVSPSESESDAMSPQIPAIESFALSNREEPNQIFDAQESANIYQHDECETASECGDDSAVSETSEADHHQAGITLYCSSGRGKDKHRKLPCYYCGEFVYKMPRHLQRKHSFETSVAAVLASGFQKTLGISAAVEYGHKHNTEVLKNGVGMLIMSHYPAKNRSADDFLPCHFLCYVLH